jgi:hypothetical protein
MLFWGGVHDGRNVSLCSAVAGVGNRDKGRDNIIVDMPIDQFSKKLLLHAMK